MNETNQLEEQLRSWIPRRPSPEIKSRIFARANSEPAISWSKVLPWLAPAAACLIAAFVTLQFGKNSSLFRNQPHSAPVFAMIGSNTVSTSSSGENFFLANSAASLERNVWAKATFRSTNEQTWTSGDNSLRFSKTNLLQ